MSELLSPRTIRLYVRLHPDSVERALLAASALSGIALAATILAHTVDWLPAPIRWQISLAAENSAATWFRSILLFAIALVSLICAQLELQIIARRAPIVEVRIGRARSKLIAWAGSACLFTGLSLNAMGSLHERIGGLLVQVHVLPSVELGGIWLGIFVLPILGMAALILFFAWRDLRDTRGVILLMTIGIALYLTLPLQGNSELASSLVFRYANSANRPAWPIVLKEGTELLGSLCCLAAGLRYAEIRSRALRRLDGKVRIDVDWRFVAGAITTLGLVLVVLDLLESKLIGVTTGRGVPQNWFPAIAALVCALFASHLAASERNRIGSPVGSWQALRLLVIVNLTLSLGYGANYPVRQLLEYRPIIQAAWMIALGATVLFTGMFAARITDSTSAGFGLLIWSAVYLLRPITEFESWSVLSTLGQLGLMFGLQRLLRDRVRRMMLVRAREEAVETSRAASCRGVA